MFKQVDKFSLQLYGAFVAILLLGIFGAIALQEPVIAGLPVLALILYLAIADYKKLFLFLVALIPLSTEVTVADNYTLKIPTEPMMFGFLVIFIILICSNNRIVSPPYFRHPIFIFLMVHLLWIAACLLYTENSVISLKFLLAKTWYVGSFFFMPLVLIRSRQDFKKIVTYLYIPLIAVTLIILARHAATGFAFDEVNSVVVPFFRNHVNYAALLSVVFPFGFFVRKWYPKGSSQRKWMTFALIILLIGIYYSYTRAAWVAMIAAAGGYFIIKYNFTRHVTLLCVAAALISVAYLAKDNKYLDFAPEYASTIYHHNLDQHLEATVQLKDLSNAERVYRWVAAFHMAGDQPWVGVGPGNFYPHYMAYTVTSFRTYVSDNEEQSTVHNYFLLMLIEQGIIGLLIFSLLVFVTLFTGERIYHRLKNAQHKQWTMATMLSFIMILTHILVSDLIETDKVGTIFFLNLAMLLILDKKSKNDQKQPVPMAEKVQENQENGIGRRRPT